MAKFQTLICHLQSSVSSFDLNVQAILLYCWLEWEITDKQQNSTKNISIWRNFFVEVRETDKQMKT